MMHYFVTSSCLIASNYLEVDKRVLAHNVEWVTMKSLVVVEEAVVVEQSVEILMKLMNHILSQRILAAGSSDHYYYHPPMKLL